MEWMIKESHTETITTLNQHIPIIWWKRQLLQIPNSSSDLLKKNKCNNNNVNINQDNTGDFNIGNNGQVASSTSAVKGDLSANAFAGGYDGERNNNNGYKNNGKFDPDCSINNNNNNNAGGDGAIGVQGPQGYQKLHYNDDSNYNLI